MNGTEWIVDAQRCSAEALRNVAILRDLFALIIKDLGLRTIGEAHWHQFPGTGGVTGMCMLSESHLTCHTFPEFGSICINLFCCVPRRRWDFETKLSEILLASSVRVVEVERDYSAHADVSDALEAAGKKSR